MKQGKKTNKSITKKTLGYTQLLHRDTKQPQSDIK